MSRQPGHIARFRRALDRQQHLTGKGKGSLSGEEEQLPGGGRLPAQVQQKVLSMRTEALLDLLREQDSRVYANQELILLVVSTLGQRLGSLAVLEEEGLEWAIPEAISSEGSAFFVGWIESEGRIEWVDHQFRPDHSQDISADTFGRYERKEACGGVFGRVDDVESGVRAQRLRHSVSKWRGRTLDALGAVDATRLRRSLGAVISHELHDFLSGLEEGRCMLALHGKKACVLDENGRIYQLNRNETKHLALVGLLPRHWFLPLQWWKQKKLEIEEEREDKKGKTRVYKGRYDDEDEVRTHEGEKDEYGG